MIDFQLERHITTQYIKKNILKHDITHEVFQIPKFQCCCINNPPFYDKRIIIYLGISDGSIISITLYRQKNLYHKKFGILLYKTPKNENHSEGINGLLLVDIKGNKRLISAGTDGTIKMWSAEPELREKDMVHFIDNIYHERSTVIDFTYFKKKELVIAIFSDIKIRVLSFEEYYDTNKKKNIIRLVVSSIIEYHVKINPNKDKQYLITTLSLKDSDINELFVGDNKGNIMTYHFVDDNYLKYQNSSSTSDKLILSKEPKYEKDKFNYIEKINLHKKFGVIKVVHSVYDNLIYTNGYDNHILCYNIKNEQKLFDIINPNNKSHITDMYLSSYGKELILGDDKGNITFIDIFSKTDFKNKPMKDKIIAIKPLNIFPNQEHILIESENVIGIFNLVRKTKISITRHHDAEIMKIFAIEPVSYDNKIIEDSRIISIGFDKKIKIWDFITMECLNEINGPELPKISITISSVRYLNDSQLIAIGTEIGKIFFWDIINSEYLPINYEDKYSHKGVVTDIITFMKNTKDDIIIECMLSCSTDGLILFWEINKIEIKESKKKNVFNYDKSDEFILNELKKRNKNLDNNKDSDDSDLNKYLKNQKRKELKLFKCSPSVKRSINTVKLIKHELKFNVLAFHKTINTMTIFSGIHNEDIYLWDYKKETYINKSKGSNSFITCMMVDKNYLFSGGIDGLIDVWNISSNQEEKEVSINLLFTINDPEMTRNNKPRINDLFILPKVYILVFCNNNKKLYFYDINKQSIVHKINRDNDITCISCLEGYGKLLCGTKQKMIIEINLNEELMKAGYKEVYDKYPFTKNKANYEDHELDKYINNFKIMKSLTEKKDIFNDNLEE